MAFQNAVIKNEIDKVMAVTDEDALLTSLKAETMPPVQEEIPAIYLEADLPGGIRS